MPTATTWPASDKLRELRLARKQTQEQVAEALGVTQALISYLETGRPTRRSTLLLVALYYGVRPETLIGEPPAKAA